MSDDFRIVELWVHTNAFGSFKARAMKEKMYGSFDKDLERAANNLKKELERRHGLDFRIERRCIQGQLDLPSPYTQS